MIAVKRSWGRGEQERSPAALEAVRGERLGSRGAGTPLGLRGAVMGSKGARRLPCRWGSGESEVSPAVLIRLDAGEAPQAGGMQRGRAAGPLAKIGV